VLHAARSKCRTQKIAKNSPSGHHRTICRAISSQLRHILTIEKTCLNSNISLTCLHNMVIFGPLTAEIRWRVWGTPANFNRFRVSLLGFVTAATSPNAANQTLHDVWPSTRLVHYVYIFGGLLPRNGILPRASKSCVLIYWQRYYTVLEQWASAKVCGVVQGMVAWRD